jgi:hypothetical protein
MLYPAHTIIRFWIDDPEVIRDFTVINALIAGHVVAQEVEHGVAEVLEGVVALVVSGVPVHHPPRRSIGLRCGQ